MNRDFFRRSRFWMLVAIAGLFIACQPFAPPTAPPGSSESSPSASVASPEPVAESVFLNGAGATFPAPLYQRWFAEYNRQHPNIQVNYQPVGSGVGIQQMVSGTVDFGASDIAMTDEQIASVSDGVVLLPMTAGSIAVVYNLPDIGSGLKLSRSVLPGIFSGQIDRWNAPPIAELNPDLALPDTPIALVHRSDGSGTTAAFTAHLSAISDAWRSQVGSGLSVQWPAGIGVKSNSGVSAQVQQASGTIGYVEYSYAHLLGLSTAALENRSGNYVEPTLETTAIALDSVELPDDLRAFVTDPDGPDAYPIATYSWVLAYRTYDDPIKAATLREVLQWALADGQAMSAELGYVPLSTDVTRRVADAIEQIGPPAS
ncbi:phosphate ABC transporter, phosphate-binding protein [Rubidibacter lacunae KORDI 51-2]|uniref:Phosphate-binding protein n=1 Tax=Rubidibacter lacunae KORDI 51-2 TaxID=582515 RepID=U5DIE4_9CHRO|nr:phosphate ABC transporter substrate-binding protein PstS [Rubidibacter lacunae]ERN40707.1 phosphate ABC transporter, phosphate-binding protein [Rubidibacter lacunae KORDI 51-2]